MEAWIKKLFLGQQLDMEKIITVKNLHKKFRKLKKRGFFKDLLKPNFLEVSAVLDISFSIKYGESVAFLGPNGAGKTTTIKMLSGLIYPSSGEIQVLGFKPSDRKSEFLSRIGLVMGNKSGLNWDLTPRQSFRLLKEIYNVSDHKYNLRLKELTELLDISRFIDTQIRRMSLGERMKMELIGSILHYPKILFLDEPTVGLDIISKQKIREFLRHIQKKDGTTILLTSHDMDDVEKVCDRVIVINKGQKVIDTDVIKLTSRFSEYKYIKLTLSNKKEFSKISFDKVEELNSEGMYKIQKSKVPEFLKYITANFDVDDIDVIPLPLEEIIKEIFLKR